MLAASDDVVIEMTAETETGTIANTRIRIGMIVAGTTATVIVVGGMLHQSWNSSSFSSSLLYVYYEFNILYICNLFN
jgi:hypothetical protein